MTPTQRTGLSGSHRMRAAEASNRLIRGNGRYMRWSQTQLLRQVRWIGSRKSAYQQSFQPAVRLLRRPAAAGGANCHTRSTCQNLEGQRSREVCCAPAQPGSLGRAHADQMPNGSAPLRSAVLRCRMSWKAGPLKASGTACGSGSCAMTKATRPAVWNGDA